MVLTAYQRLCYKALGGLAKGAAAKSYRLKDELLCARIELLPEAYLAYTWLNTVIGVFVGFVAAVIINLLLPSFLPLPDIFHRLIFILLPILFGAGTYAVFISAPSSRAKKRKRDIDRRLPYAANFIAAMASAHAAPQTIFRSLGKQEEIYGEISKEASWIYRDTTALGVDLISALKNASLRSPSEKFRDFINGTIGTLTAGGDLKTYFISRAEYYMREGRREQRDFIETLGILGESYLVVAVATPLLLLIMMVVMSWVGGGGFEFSPGIMALIIFILLPVIHLAYAYIIWSASPGM
ncbi:MAG: type II secretion system F family protein [Candidatus Thermoplasmatota archaeon]|nr:type II secretion system F family protein [Candidatus Thermoplasmatota archaeon]